MPHQDHRLVFGQLNECQDFYSPSLTSALCPPVSRQINVHASASSHPADRPDFRTKTLSVVGSEDDSAKQHVLFVHRSLSLSICALSSTAVVVALIDRPIIPRKRLSLILKHVCVHYTRRHTNTHSHTLSICFICSQQQQQ